jgi:hypothetical protein
MSIYWVFVCLFKLYTQTPEFWCVNNILCIFSGWHFMSVILCIFNIYVDCCFMHLIVKFVNSNFCKSNMWMFPEFIPMKIWLWFKGSEVRNGAMYRHETLSSFILSTKCWTNIWYFSFWQRWASPLTPWFYRREYHDP